MADEVGKPGVVVREFALTDYGAAASLWRVAGPGVPWRPGDERGEIARMLDRNPGLLLVACRGDEVVGTVIGGWDGRRGQVYHLAVDPGWRRRGVAGELMDELEARFAALGAWKVKGEVYSDNTASLAFFRDRGYKVEDTIARIGKELAPPAR